VKRGFILIFFLLFSYPLFAQFADEIETAARDALNRLEALLGGNVSANPSTPLPAPNTIRGGSEPRWVIDPYTAYPRDRYIAAVGHASNRAEAEKHALLELIGFFGQSIQGESMLHTTYSEAVSREIITVSKNFYMQDVIVTSTSMDTLIGAQIGYIWENERGIVYALAYLDREKTISIYTDLIHLNNLTVEQLTAMNDVQKNTFDGYARYKLAEAVSRISAKYATVVSLSGGSTSSLNIKSAGLLNLEASDILQNITVMVSVSNDRANRIRDAFVQALSAENLRTRGNSPPYTLEVDVDLSELTFPNNSFIFCHYVVSANLIENSTGAVLFPFNFSGREGHSTYANAVIRAIAAAENEIKGKYPDVLRDYLAGVFPQE